MEIEAQVEFIEVQSPIDRCKGQWAQQGGATSFFRQRNFLLESPELVQYAELARSKGWAQPLRFGLQGLLLAAFFISALSWLIASGEGIYAERIAAVRAEMESEIKTAQGMIDAAEFNKSRIEKSRKNDTFSVAGSTALTKEEALAQLNALIEDARKLQQEYQYNADIKAQNLRAAGDGFDLAASGTPVMFTLALLFSAPLFRRLLQNSYPSCRLVGQADTYYIYYVVARGVWLNCLLVVLLNIFFSASGYGLAGFFDGIGPIGRILFWLGLYSLLLYWFFGASKDLYKAMQLPRPRDFTDFENKVLLHLHNSFWMVFLVLESALGLLAWSVYLTAKAH